MKRSYLLVFGLLFCFQASFCANNELLLNGSTQVLPLAPGTEGILGVNSGELLTVAVAYNYRVMRYLQLGIFPSLVHGGSTIFSLMGGATLNLIYNRRFQDAFFASFLLGFVDVASTQFAFRFDFGKRFRIFPHVSYRPSFGMLKVSGGSALFVFNLLGMSLVF